MLNSRNAIAPCLVLWGTAWSLMACAPNDDLDLLYEGDDPGECSDGADNDRDGDFDCDDENCEGAPACDEEENTKTDTQVNTDTNTHIDTDIHGLNVGLDDRPPNTTCIAPDRPPSGAAVEIATEQMFNNMVLTYALDLAPHPTDTNRWYLAQRGWPNSPDDIGKISVIDWVPGNAPDIQTFVQLDNVAVDNEAGVLGLALHPNFEVNGQLYLSYNVLEGDPWTSRISRVASADDGWTAPEDSEDVLLSLLQPANHHQGGGLRFGPDGYLYVSFGDGGVGHEAEAANSHSWFGAILRIDVDTGSPYAIPSDNPFATDPGGAPEVWAWGLRNPWRFSIDPVSGLMYLGDVGYNTWEEIDVIERGGNYGWPVFEGEACNLPPCDPNAFQPPLVVHLHADEGGDAKAIIGGRVYQGDAIPQLRGVYVYGDNNGNVWGLFYDKEANPTPQLMLTGIGGLRSFAVDHDGELVIVGDRIFRIIPAGKIVNTFPQTLSETGCVDPANPTAVAAGVIPYDVNVELWSDGAEKHRWMAVPDGTFVTIQENGDWDLPIGSVLIKEFRLNNRRIETRLLVRHDDGGWAGYSYEWNVEETEATLLGGSKLTTIDDQSWLYPSRPQCFSCHTTVAGRTLGLTTAQFNRATLYPSTGRTANQLETLDHIGMFSKTLGASADQLPVLPGLEHTNETLNHQARGYLQANCAHCHAPDGPTQATMDLLYETPFLEMNICNVPSELSDLEVDDALLLDPGSPDTSLMSVRMGDLVGTDRMPPLATEIVHTDGLALIDEWISSVIEEDGACLGPDSDGDGTPDP